MPLLGYLNGKTSNQLSTRQRFLVKIVINLFIGLFADIGKMVGLGSVATRNVKDYKLSRYACYLIAQKRRFVKTSCANAQTYFAIQARRQELAQSLDDDKKRLFIREEIRQQNKQLFKTAKKAGVTEFGKFNDFGYLGLYNMHISSIKEKKKIGKDSIIDRAGSLELAANLFRITQAEDKIRREDIKGQSKANVAHFVVGKKFAETIKDIGGTMPEDLLPQKNIKSYNKDK